MILRAGLLLLLLLSAASGGPFSLGTRGMLKNGLEVILLRDPSLPVVATGIFIRAGSQNESEATSGATHLLEHLLFNGTEDMSQDELYTFMELHGLYINAATRQRGTVFIGLSAPDEMDALLDVQAGMLFASIIAAESFEKEKLIVLEELAGGRTRSDEYISVFHKALIFAGSSCRFPVLGSPATIEAMSRDILYTYYKTYYVPNNMTLVLMGDFPWPQTWNKLQASFGAYSPAPAPASKPCVLPNVRSIPPETISVPAPSPAVLLTLAAPGPEDPDFPAVYLMSKLLPEVSNEMCDATISSLSANLWIGAQESRLTITITLPDKAALQTLGTQLDSLLVSLCQRLSSHDELELGRIGWETDMLLWMERPHMFAIMIYDLLAGLGWEKATRLEQAIHTMDPENFSQAVRKWLIGAPRSSLVVLPGEEMPSFEALDPQPRGSISLGRPRGQKMPTFREVIPKISPQIEDSMVIASTLLDTLSSGMVICVREETGLPVAGLFLLFRKKADFEDSGKEGTAEIYHRLLGTGPSTIEESTYHRRIRQLGASIKVTDNPFLPFDDYYYSSRWGYIRVTTPMATFLETTKLVATTLRHPRLDSLLVQQERKAVQRLLFREQRSPRKAATYLLWDRLHPGDPRSRSPLGKNATIQGIGLKDVESFIERYVDGSNIILTAHVPNNGKALLDSLSSFFDWIPGQGTPGALRPTPRLNHGPWVAKDSLGLGQERLVAVLGLPVEKTERRAARLLAGILDRRMQRVLREEKGLAYGLGAWASFEGTAGLITASMGTRPERIIEAETGFKRVIAELVTTPVKDRGELRATAKSLERRTLMRRLTRAGKAMAMGLKITEGDHPDTMRSDEHGLLGVTDKDLLRIASRLDRNRIGWVIIR